MLESRWARTAEEDHQVYLSSVKAAQEELNSYTPPALSPATSPSGSDGTNKPDPEDAPSAGPHGSGADVSQPAAVEAVKGSAEGAESAGGVGQDAAVAEGGPAAPAQAGSSLHDLD